MANITGNYIIIGGGLAGAYAVEGIREHDQDGKILLFGVERYLPYDRPPLSKKLWFGQKQVQDIFVHDDAYYQKNNVDLRLNTKIVKLTPKEKTVIDSNGALYHYEKLLLATGGTPKRLNIPGGDLDGICYYRYLDDYYTTRAEAVKGKTATVIGGGFIGSELAAALNHNGVDVKMVFPEQHILQSVFPTDLAESIMADYKRRGIEFFTGDVPLSFEKTDNRFVTLTRNGNRLVSDIVIVGIGIKPNLELADEAGLVVENGIAVNEYLQTSEPDIYAAGDNALFPYIAIGDRRRVEHWDNAVNQGRYAGMNMAGARIPYDYMPYFFSDLFDFGYEAVGDTDPKLDVFEDWQNEFDTGVIYYLKDGKVRGAMMCNVWDKVDAAREIIRKSSKMTQDILQGAIKAS